MQITHRLGERGKALLWAVGVTIAYFGIAFFALPPIYAINDDVMIESLLSGSYLEPYPYSYYFSAELGWVISTLYRLLPGVPWLGFFYLLCNGACVFALECLVFFKKERTPLQKAFFSALTLAGVSALCFQNFILVHYTCIAAILGATGILLLLLTRGRRYRLTAVVFILFSYLVRENVFFLLAPFTALVWLWLFLDKQYEGKKAFFADACLFFFGFVLLFLLNRGMLSGREWKEYLAYNQVRTEVYDYYGVHLEEEALRHYESRGLTQGDLSLMRHYDLALFHDGTGNFAGLKMVSEYGQTYKESVDPGLVEWVKSYLRRFVRQKDDAPWNVLVILLYAGIFVLLCWEFFGKKEDRRSCVLALLILIMAAGYRSMAWTYLIRQGRFPQRVTLSFYWMEIAFLIGYAILLLRKRTQIKLLMTFAAALGVFFLAATIFNVKQTVRLHEEQTQKNQADDLLINYFEERRDQFFLLDLYATVNRTKLALSVGKKENYLLLGGWMTRHPLYFEKINRELPGAENAWELLMQKDNVIIVLKENAGISRETLEDALSVKLIEVDRLVGENEKFLFYGLDRE